MAVTEAQAQPTPPQRGAAKTKAASKKTTLDADVAMPGFVAPGDAPFDTVDPDEIATSVSPHKGEAGKKGFGVVNAVLPLERIPGNMTPEEVRAYNGLDEDGGERVETYEVPGPTGKPVKVTHNIDTGETEVSGS